MSLPPNGAGAARSADLTTGCEQTAAAGPSAAVQHLDPQGTNCDDPLQQVTSQFHQMHLGPHQQPILFPQHQLNAHNQIHLQQPIDSSQEFGGAQFSEHVVHIEDCHQSQDQALTPVNPLHQVQNHHLRNLSHVPSSIHQTTTTYHIPTQYIPSSQVHFDHCSDTAPHGFLMGPHNQLPNALQTSGAPHQQQLPTHALQYPVTQLPSQLNDSVKIPHEIVWENQDNFHRFKVMRHRDDQHILLTTTSEQAKHPHTSIEHHNPNNIFDQQLFASSRGEHDNSNKISVLYEPSHPFTHPSDRAVHEPQPSVIHAPSASQHIHEQYQQPPVIMQQQLQAQDYSSSFNTSMNGLKSYLHPYPFKVPLSHLCTLGPMLGGYPAIVI